MKFLEEIKYNKYLIDKNDEISFSYLRIFLKKIEEYEKFSDNKSVAGFISYVSLELESGEQGDLPKEAEEGPEAVKVMTAHGAKGLEFKYVFVVNLVDKRFPSIERREPIELPDELVKEIIPTGDIHLQEERRLFYVAITRAKRGVWFSSAENYGGKTRKKLSRFIYEIGMEKVPSFKAQDTKNLQVLSSKINKEKESFKHELPSSFSYSKLRSYDFCPYQYYLASVLKVPVKSKYTFSFGNTMHNTLQRFMGLISEGSGIAQDSLFAGKGKKKVKKLPDLNELLKIYRELLIDEWYETKEDKKRYYQLGEKSLKVFYEQLKKDAPKVIGLEQNFNLKIGQYKVSGKIDRIDKLADGQVAIIDYKTENPKTDKTLPAKSKEQLYIYQLAAEEVFGFKVRDLSFYYLRDNSRVDFLGNEKQLSGVKDKVLGIIKKIKKGNFEAEPEKHKCNNCDYKEICEFRAL